MKNKTLKKLVKTAGRILLVLSVFFVGYKIYNLGIDFSVVTDIPRFLFMAFLALVLNVLSTFIQALVWGRWISFFSGTRVNKANALTIYGKSSIGKYLPGNVMHYVERNLFAAEYGLSQDKIAFSSVMEIIGQVMAAVLISVILLPKSFMQEVLRVVGDNSKTLIILVIIGISVLIAAAVFTVIKKVNVAKYLKEYKASDFIVTLIVTLIGSVVYLIMNGCGMVFLWTYCSGSVPGIENIRLIVSSYAAAWVCGFVIPGAPGGIGIREAVLSILLGDITGGILMFMIIVHRLITIIGDFTVYLIVSLRGVRRKD